MTKTIISARTLDVGYGNKAVISNVNLEAVKGQVICLLGPNGAGKSTILRTLAGLLAPMGGVVEIDGINLKKAKKKEIACKLSLVLTEAVSPALTTVYALISMGRTPYTDFLGRLSERDKRIVDESLETVGAIHLRDRFFSELSDGEKQKVMIARALVQEPKLMILDEPTSHLDIKHKIEVIRILQKLANDRGITCILSLHDIDLALKGCQTVMLVNEGEIVAQGAPEEIVHSGLIQELYGIRGAEYHELTGSVELKGKDANEVFVTGGDSSGVNLYRALSRKGFGLTAGILHRNDTDYKIALSICSRVVSEQPFECIGDRSMSAAKLLIAQARCVIDSGFLVGRGNLGNIELIKKALAEGKRVLSMRPMGACRDKYGELAHKITCFHSVTELSDAVGKMKGSKDEA